jgi:hypothetical protein
LEKKAMTTTVTNGRTARKSLADQIDRLDHILDGLADALNESVADAVRQVIGQVVAEAVQAAVAEVLSSPQLLQAALERHAPAEPGPVPPPPPPAPAPTRASGLGAWLWGRTKQACAALYKGADRLTAAVKQGLRIAKPYRKSLLVAAGVGTIVAVGACLAGPWLAAPMSWLGGFVSTLAVRAGAALQRGLGLTTALT